MRILAILLLILLAPCLNSQAASFKRALPGYKFAFPHDHASHEDFQTEWWYYTGHLTANDKRKFGYELTFFRQELAENTQKQQTPGPKNIYMAHFAITDEHNHKFTYFEKLNRTALDIAGARSDCFQVFNENWFVEQLGNKIFIRADAPAYSIHLVLEPLKTPVVHGKDSVFQKAGCIGCASHYYSMSRLKTEGILFIDKKPIAVTGSSWMDHEFGSHQLAEDEIGWDWYGIQLDNNTELMIYILRTSNGCLDSNSAGTFIFANGTSKPLAISDINIKRLGVWPSPTKKGSYPMGWNVSIPSMKLQLELTPVMENQEIVPLRTKGLGYWEGKTNVAGTLEGKSISGQAYVEMTGYGEKFRKKI